jgi:sarcosine oxidase subunit alpha
MVDHDSMEPGPGAGARDTPSREAAPGPHRVTEHSVLGPPPDRAPVAFSFDGATFQGLEGEPVAAALLAHGVRTLRASPSGRARAAYCFIGHCFECRVIVDGVRHERACLTPLRPGMVVTRCDG